MLINYSNTLTNYKVIKALPQIYQQRYNILPGKNDILSVDPEKKRHLF